MKKLLACILAVSSLAVCALSGTACSNRNIQEEQAATKVGQSVAEGGLSLGESAASEIALMNTALLSSEYENYGVSPLAETAYTLTATVTPEDAGNQMLDWSIAWVNTNSIWADGKIVSDYVTLETLVSGGKTATVSCLQPFGEQIKITVQAKDDANKFAVCLVDYVQKVESASLHFGNLPINLGGSTAIQYEIGKSIQGPGGEVYAELETSDVYTIAEDFAYSVQFSGYAEYAGTGNVFSLNGSGISSGINIDINTEYYGKSIYFDYDHDVATWFIMTRAGDILFRELTTAEIATYFDNITSPGLVQVNFTVTGKYNSYSYTSQLYCSGYTNHTPVSAVALSLHNYVF